jgi:hypothetical protein
VGTWVEDPSEPSGWRWDRDAEPTAVSLAVEEREDLAGQLGTVTDQEWRQAHERLIADMPDLAEQLAYLWDPQLDGRTLVAAHERDMAPRPHCYDPGRDERFRGGGFRG